ncbi:hypothetical protein [Cerasicoccus frondis]|uniref:hypothetical protein n=1 Tax=Cerasicoccus frondis TaxID=490090 RepID=UPI0028524B40|nr:hypothetical protein [Cerasicoccus frondis]
MLKNYRLSLLAILACVVPGIAAFAQKVDWSNAPLNPIPVKYKTEHFNLKGPVFSADKQVFGEDGRMIKDISYVRYEDGQPISKGSVPWETDAEGRVTREYYFSGRDSHFEFRDDGLLSKTTHKYNNSEEVIVYSYDDAGRLNRIQKTDGDRTETTTYDYQVDGDNVHITETTQKGDSPAKRRFLTYTNGLLTASRAEGDTIELTVEYEFDDYGNPTKMVHAQNNGVRDEFKTRYQYYPEIKQRNELLYGAVPKDRTTPVSVFRNGDLAKEVAFTHREGKRDVIIYDDFNESYYRVDLSEPLKPGERRPAELLIANADTIAFLYDDSIEPFYRGLTVFKDSKNKASVTANTGIITYSDHERLSSNYSLFFDMESGEELLTGRLLDHTTRFASGHMYYVVGDSGELELFYLGSSIENPLDRIKGKVGEDDLVFYDGDRPKYVLPGALNNPKPGVYPFRFFDGDNETVTPLPDDYKFTADVADLATIGSRETVPGYTTEDVAALYTFTPEEKQSYARAYVNKTDAPLNPFAYVSGLPDLNLEGDIAYYLGANQRLYFDEDGTRFDPTGQYFTDEETARREKATYRLFDNGNKLLMEKHYTNSLWDIDAIYKYNQNGTIQSSYYITTDGQLVEVNTYEYDDDRRVIKQVRQSGKKTINFTYGYEDLDGQLQVTMSITGPSIDKTLQEVYGNGRLVRKVEKDGDKVTEETFQYMNDHFGNAYVRMDQDGKQTEINYYYHSDTWQPDRWHWINEAGLAENSYPYVYAHDLQVGQLDGSYSEKRPFSHGIFYEPIAQNYYIGENAMLPATKKNPNARGKLELKVSSTAMLYLAKNGQINLYDRGRALSGNKQFRSGNSLALYNTKNGHTYLIRDLATGEEKLFPATDLGTDVVLWYRASAEGNLSFFDNGGAPDGKLANGGYYPNGDLLVLKDDQPWGILEDADLKRPGATYQMLPYDNRGRPGEKTPPPKYGNISHATYSFSAPVILKREAGQYRFYQNGQQLFLPRAFHVGDSGNAFAHFGNSYRLFEQAKGLTAGQELRDTQLIMDPLLLEQNGDKLRVWWEGNAVPEGEYVLIPCDDGSRFLYLTKLKKPIEIKVGSSYLNYSVGSTLWAPNVLIKNKDGFYCVERGVIVQSEDVTLQPFQGNIVIYIESDPVYVISGVEKVEDLPIGIHPLTDFSY